LNLLNELFLQHTNEDILSAISGCYKVLDSAHSLHSEVQVSFSQLTDSLLEKLKDKKSVAVALERIHSLHKVNQLKGVDLFEAIDTILEKGNTKVCVCLFVCLCLLFVCLCF
jgi:hypothetical protein